MLETLRIKAEAGNALAQYELATALATGSLCERNGTDSFYWYMKAALKGHVEAMWHAGLHLIEGSGVERTVEAGLHLIHLAANKSNYKALRFLGDVYHTGAYGMPMDKHKGDNFYRRAKVIENSDLDR